MKKPKIAKITFQLNDENEFHDLIALITMYYVISLGKDRGTMMLARNDKAMPDDEQIVWSEVTKG